VANVSWHNWLSDGELSLTSYPEGTGYYENLGPPYAHTVYGQLPADMRQKLKSIASLTSNVRDDKIRAFIDNINQNFLKDKKSESTQAFASAIAVYKQQTSQGVAVDPSTMFTDATLRQKFNIQAGDEQATSTAVNGSPARTKNSPNTNVQALMSYELMTKGISCACWIESRKIRGFDTHYDRASVFANRGQIDQMQMMRDNLWTPLNTFAQELKGTHLPDGSGRSYWDVTTIVLASEMGRIMGQVDAESLREDGSGATNQYTEMMKQDICQHWHISSAALLGGTVNGNTQWGRVGTSSQMSIPLMPDGSLDPNYDPQGGSLLSGRAQDPNSKVPDAGSIYATALYCSGLDPDGLRAQGKGRNTSPPLKYVKKGG
jgi:hypothetical protein